MSTPSPPRRISDEEELNHDDDYQDNSEFGNSSTNPNDQEYQLDSKNLDGEDRNINEEDGEVNSESRNNSPQRVFSPSEENKERKDVKKHPYPSDGTQLKTFLQLKKDKLLEFFKRMMNEELAVDFMQYLDQNIEIKDSELYPKLREFLVDRGHTFGTLSTEKCFDVKASDIQTLLPKKNFAPQSIVHIFCEEGNILSTLKEAYPTLTTLIGADTRDIISEENKDKFQFVQFQENDPFKLEGIQDETADIVILNMKLYKYEQHNPILEEIKRIMKRGAFFVLSEFHCNHEDLRLFNDIINGFYATVFSDPIQNENFCSTYKGHYKSKFTWENFLRSRSLFSFKDTRESGLFKIFFASFKKDILRGSSSRKRGLFNQNRNPYQNAPNQGPPLKRRRFNEPSFNGPPTRGGFPPSRGRGFIARGGHPQNPNFRGNALGRYQNQGAPNVRSFQDAPQDNWNMGWNQMWNGNAWNQMYPQQPQLYPQQQTHFQNPQQSLQQQQQQQQPQYMFNHQPRYNRGNRNFHQNQPSEGMNYQAPQQFGNSTYQDQNQYNS